MKYNHLLLLLLLFGVRLSAQKWTPVISGEMQHYRLGNAGHITHTLRIDSVKTTGADSVFYLNRVLDRFFFPVVPGQQDTFFAPLPGQGQFIGQTMTRKPDGSLVFHAEHAFFDTTIILWPMANTGFSWVAVAKDQVTASVESVTEGTVLGETDSLKVIQFSNGAQWVLSQHHGLVSCPDMKGYGTVQLTGLESRQLGDRLYKYEDFFDFQVGDVFEYKGYSYYLTGSLDYTTKNTVLEKVVDPEKNAYYVEQKWRHLKIGHNAGLTMGTDTLWWNFKRSEIPHLGSYPGQLFRITDDYFLWQDRYSVASHFEDGLLLGTKNWWNTEDEQLCSVLEASDGWDPDNPVISLFAEALQCSGQVYMEEYTRGLGRTAYTISIIDNFLSERLAGAVVQGDTIGTLTPDWIFTAVKTPANAGPTLSIYPNPARDQMTVHIEKTHPGAVQITLTDALGRPVRRFDGNSGQNTDIALDLAGIHTGTYLLQLRCEDGTRTEKVFILK